MAESMRKKTWKARITVCRSQKDNLQKNEQTKKEQILSIFGACLSIALFTAQEQSNIRQGTYVRLHGLNKKQYSGQEGMVVKCEKDKAEVRLAETGHNDNNLIKVHRKNLTLMPTYTTSRCKLREHEIVEMTFYPEPVVGWPRTLTGSYFEYLGVERTATGEQIKAAYRNLSILLHPDKNPTHVEKATNLFKQVKEAYDALKDDFDRTIYLQKLRMQEARQQGYRTNPFEAHGFYKR